MKNLLCLILAVGLLTSVTAQKPYVSVGASLSTDIVTTSVELGCYTANDWFAVVGETFEVNKQQEYYVGVKYYHKVYSPGKKTDIYGFGAVKVNTDGYNDLVFEPGVALVANIGKRFALQTSLSTPIYEGSNVFRPTWLSAGLSLNWWIR